MTLKAIAVKAPPVEIRLFSRRTDTDIAGQAVTAAAAPVQPGDESLCVEVEVTLEPRQHPLRSQPAAVAKGQLPPEVRHCRADGRGPIRSCRALPGDAGQLADLSLEGFPEPRHIGDSAEVHEVHRLGRVREQPVDRGDELLRVELCRRSGRDDEGAAWRVELAIGDAEGVARE